MSAHAAGWTPARRLADRFIGRERPGKHHPIWDAQLGPEWVPMSRGGVIHQPRFDALAAQMFGGTRAA
ncbi:hypothetical protein NNX28_16835 [Arthrobacter sp. zg-Y859]|uniref:Uncharacterized protein n=1 Tax=Arthrobacter jinronghuae TaxID=2964609 RepID=A0ABT1NV98_9MICC|nr:hypothetical protein [Arthrobacter jinronghuae]MCQ1951585.1 hypothetical protein [Arthrobacter jinronghuae]UWX79700.1 hypothetical protein N2K98_05745 [Arthrobacter jinronghuae]